jgi:DNA mismatch repair endonuclease MutH
VPIEAIEIQKLKSVDELLDKAKWLEGKTLSEIAEVIKKSDNVSRVVTKGDVGYVIEKGFFGIERNSESEPDITHLGVEVKTCPLKFNKDRTKLSVKEPLSLNIINYMEEHKNNDITQSSLYKKNKKMLLILYIHDKEKKRSEYIIKYVFLWVMDEKVLNELRPDYMIIINKIREGKAHEIHQKNNKYLTLCPKHSGHFKDPNCKKSKRQQPFSDKPAEVRAFRLKNKYMNIVISRHLGKTLDKGGWNIN